MASRSRVTGSGRGSRSSSGLNAGSEDRPVYSTQETSVGVSVRAVRSAEELVERARRLPEMSRTSNGMCTFSARSPALGLFRRTRRAEGLHALPEHLRRVRVVFLGTAGVRE